MNKEFFANIEYNKKKRFSTIILAILLIVCMGCMIAVCIKGANYVLLTMFVGLLLIPIFLIPMAFLNYPINSKPIIVINDKFFTSGKETHLIKDIVKIIITIDVAQSKLDSENKMLLEKLKTAKLDDEDFGSFDIVVKNGNKNKVLYNSICNVKDALYSFIELGIKNYSVIYSMKRNSVHSTYNYIDEIRNTKEKANQKVSKKVKMKDII